jgi:2Fe-2S ferredoxin
MPSVTFKKNRLLREDHAYVAEPGTTLLAVARAHGIPVGSNCGGVCGCSTCHVHVVRGLSSLEEMDDREADRLDRAFDVRLDSRLGCQVKLGAVDLVVDISDESLDAYLAENPDVRRHLEATGELLLVPHDH